MNENDGIQNMFGAMKISSGVELFKKDAADQINATESGDTGPAAQSDSVPDAATYHEVMTEEFEQNDVRIAMIGNVDSGKSTLIGVLTNSTLDDGRGAARAMVLKHRHEQENGRTSAVTVEIMGYKSKLLALRSQELLNDPSLLLFLFSDTGEQVFGTSRNPANRWAEVMEKSDHSVTLIDLCGHEKYLKTTLFGLTGLMPDYCMLVVGSNMGVQLMTREHIAIACALNIPMFVAVTKVLYRNCLCRPGY
jgi:GTPase